MLSGIRYGELTHDEYFITEKAAKEGVVITNASTAEAIVMLKHFAENPKLELLKVLCEMRHSDKLVIADGKKRFVKMADRQGGQNESLYWT